jgi:3(or 17)beta-hydroxysteroid dehydrogenase
MDRVKGKVAIVTGGSGVLGKAESLLLATEGGRVVVTDIVEAGGKEVVAEIGRRGGEAIFMPHDVSNEEDWKAVIDQTVTRFGRLDVLVNNAGVVVNKPIEEMALSDWRSVMAVNLDGVFLGTKHAVGAMKKSGGGSIVNISSVAGLVGMGGNSSAYSASKGGVRLFSKASALQLSKAGHGYNIRVNSVHPAFILTPLMESVFRAEAQKTGRSYEEVVQMRADWTMVGHLGEPEDVAYAVVYLASDESKFVTGTELVVDGGFTAR